MWQPMTKAKHQHLKKEYKILMVLKAIKLCNATWIVC